ncbi:MAG: UDP-N-acetylglucosamine 1-carboxyvinyltransferase [Eubacteriales bacterium]|nr:UDP-N-acetylglucosamine 1-carboxyvinyltransferase [Eubacteriales bacterium]
MKIINNGPLFGECDISTSKNAILPILAASLLTKETVVIRKVPKITDVNNMIFLLKAFGAGVTVSKDTLTVSARTIKTTSPNEYMAGKLRASFLFMGPLLAREGYVTMPLPGGCRIGLRPIDLHIKGFKALGAKVITVSGHVITWGKSLSGGTIYLDYPSVGATENIIMAACLARGTTTVIGAAAEPEITDLVHFLKSMGAKIHTIDSGRIIIEGVDTLGGTDYTPISDRIEAGTLMLAAAVSGGDIRLNRANINHLEPVSLKLAEAGAEIFPYSGGLRIKGKGAVPMDIVSSPYPGFPTDMQAPFMAACCIANGVSTVSETVFENRFLHVAELEKMGADITVAGRTAVITGRGHLSGAEVCATDLRAGAALCIAGLVAHGETIIKDIYHLERGYEDLEGKFKRLGASIQRMS